VSYQVNRPPKDWLTALLLAIFLGEFGAQSFYTGKIGIGILQLVTLGGCGIWTIIDIILIATGSYRDAQGRPLVRSNTYYT
jgi:TM2 domain-containing membrane protein YozV